MIEKTGNIWAFREPGDWVVITTNGSLRRDGKLVMGRGIALEAATTFRHLQLLAGKAVQEHGLRVIPLPLDKLILFPVKHHYLDKADINLLTQALSSMS